MPETIVDPTTQTRYQCRHIRTSGHRCGSPALRQQNFCYYHHTTRKPVSREERDRRTQSISQAEARHQTFDLPLPEDRAAIQLSIGEILRRIALNQIDPRRAGLLLYGLQIAALNLPPQPRTTTESSTSEVVVEELVEDEIYGPLAPVSPITVKKGPRSLEEILLEQWEKDKAEDAALEAQAISHKPSEMNTEYLEPQQINEPYSTNSSIALPSLRAAAYRPGPIPAIRCAQNHFKSLDTLPTPLYGRINYPKIDLLGA